MTDNTSATLVLIFAVACSIQVACTPPTPAVPKERRVLNDLSLVNPSLRIYKSTCWIHGFIETIILLLPIIARQFPRSAILQWACAIFFELVLPPSGEREANIFFPLLRMLGAFLVVSGGAIRYWCFRELGRHFTFHITLLENHRLVTTGPYRIVRHPSYTGAILASAGSILWHATSGSWLLQSRFYTNPIAWIFFIPAIIVTGSSVVMCALARTEKEDELLKKEFGKKWEDWARKVPYRICPGIY